MQGLIEMAHHFRLVLAFTFAVVTSTACTHVCSSPPSSSEMTHQNFPTLPLLSPNLVTRPFNGSQNITIIRNGESQQLESSVQWDAVGMHLALLKFGRRIMTVHYDGIKTDTQKESFVPDALKGEQMLTDIQLVYWPTDVLQKHLPMGYVLTDNGDVRTLSYQARPVYQIEYHADGMKTNPREHTIHLSHFIYGYEMTITTTE